LQRARETAEAICRRTRLPIEIEPDLNEIDFGRWTNCRFAELRTDPEWQRFNSNRSSARAPDGELMLAAQARAVGAIEKLRQQHGVRRSLVTAT
jgi:probable phosphoglycerate mutase